VKAGRNTRDGTQAGKGAAAFTTPPPRLPTTAPQKRCARLHGGGACYARSATSRRPREVLRGGCFRRYARPWKQAAIAPWLRHRIGSVATRCKKRLLRPMHMPAVPRTCKQFFSSGVCRRNSETRWDTTRRLSAQSAAYAHEFAAAHLSAVFARRSNTGRDIAKI